MSDLPILWSFRRCPYAMRARLAVRKSGVAVELREILLRDKPEAFLETSESGTVPALQANDQVLDESLDIMIWALERNDPDGWLAISEEGWDLVRTNDGPFKSALDRTKYASRYPDADANEEREKASAWLHQLDERLENGWLLGEKPSICDAAILPFLWLQQFLDSPEFTAIMPKYPVWTDGQPGIEFP